MLQLVQHFGMRMTNACANRFVLTTGVIVFAIFAGVFFDDAASSNGYVRPKNIIPR